MGSSLFKRWTKRRFAKRTYPSTTPSFAAGGPWSDNQWHRFHEFYQPPLRYYARTHFNANFQEAEDAFRDLCCDLFKHPYLACPKPGILFRATICQMFKTKLLKRIEKRTSYRRRLQRAVRKGVLFFIPSPAEDRRRERIQQQVLAEYLAGLFLEKVRLYNISELDHMIWKSVMLDHIRQVEVARITGRSAASVNASVKKINVFLRDRYKEICE